MPFFTGILTLLCQPYEVCKCILPPGMENLEKHYTCAPDTCEYVGGVPPLGCSRRSPTCENIIKSWEDCEWANFNQLDEKVTASRPGNRLYMDIPTFEPVDASNGFQVMTDLDDTVICSGGPPGGVDSACKGTERHGIYPGVAEFLLALARGRGQVEPLSVLPLSARPEFLAHGCESDETAAHFRSVAERADFTNWTLDVCNGMYGNMRDVVDKFQDFLGFSTDLTYYERFGRRKYLNWLDRRSGFSKPAVFVGDNGQGDLIAAQMMIKKSSGKNEAGSVHFAFIQDVRGVCQEDQCRQDWATHGIYFFNDYAEATDIAQKRSFINESN